MWDSPPLDIGLDKDPRVPRKRAPVACLKCRERKIRCDGARHGFPCSNCRLDNEECSVMSRRRRCRVRRANDSHADKVQSPSTPDEPALSYPNPDPLFALLEQNLDDEVHDPMTPLPDDFFMRQIGLEHQIPETIEDDVKWNPRAALSARESPPAQVQELRSASGGPQPPRHAQEVLYTHHRFLHRNDFSHLSTRDFGLLDTQGCLRVPTRPVLDEFIRQYFLYIHPLLPMLDEADFWRSYRNEHDSCESFSLLLIQSMLFATCNCVSADAILAMGFSSARAARAELYRRAKILYDMEAECSPPAVTQSALLLSFWTPPGEPRGRKPNTSWLAIATHQARNEGAHLYQSWPSSESTRKRRTSWKRIWWCCIIRDRVLSLGLRRSPQITSDNFDFGSSDPLALSDFQDEIESSEVYNRDAKTLLAHILLRFARLCADLTQLQSMPPWLEARQEGNADRSLSILRNVRQTKSRLRTWRERADAVFSVYLHDGGFAGNENAQCKAVAVHLHMMYMYYYSAATSLSHQEILLVTMVVPEGSPYEVLKTGYMSTLFNELGDASKGFTECLDSLLSPGLIPLLPISIAAFLAIPFIHHTLGLDVRNGHSNIAAIKKSNRLDALTSAIKIFQEHYDGVEWLTSVLQKALQSESHCQVDKPDDKEGPCGVEDGPLSYLRMAFTVDFSLSKSRHAEKSDMPACLGERTRETTKRAQSRANRPDGASINQLSPELLDLSASLQAGHTEILYDDLLDLELPADTTLGHEIHHNEGMCIT